MRRFLDWLWGMDSTNVALVMGALCVLVIGSRRAMDWGWL